MEIDRIIFPINTLGLGDRVGIWTVGCPRRCFNCSNPELQQSNINSNINILNIIAALVPHKDKIQGVTLTGGDPFFQKEELSKLLSQIYENITKDIIVFTGYRLEELIEKNDKYINNSLDKISVLIDGEYREELNDGVGITGSSNQRICVLNKEYYEVYKDAHLWERKVQNVFYRNNSMHIGIPIKYDNSDRL